MQTQFITDTKGKKISAILPIKEYEVMLEQMDELACIKAYDKAKSKKSQQFISLKDTFKLVEKNRNK